MHPTLKNFCDTYKDRWSDLTIVSRDEDGGYLKLFWRTSGEYGFTVTAFMFGDNTDPSFEYDDGAVVCKPDHLDALLTAFACHLFDAEWESEGDPEIGTFGARVWLKRHMMRLNEIDIERSELILSILRLRPTTLSDLPLLSIDNTHINPINDDAQHCQVCICSPCGCDTEE